MQYLFITIYLFFYTDAMFWPTAQFGCSTCGYSSYSSYSSPTYSASYYPQQPVMYQQNPVYNTAYRPPVQTYYYAPPVQTYTAPVTTYRYSNPVQTVVRPPPVRYVVQTPMITSRIIQINRPPSVVYPQNTGYYPAPISYENLEIARLQPTNKVTRLTTEELAKRGYVAGGQGQTGNSYTKKLPSASSTEEEPKTSVDVHEGSSRLGVQSKGDDEEDDLLLEEREKSNSSGKNNKEGGGAQPVEKSDKDVSPEEFNKAMDEFQTSRENCPDGKCDGETSSFKKVETAEVKKTPETESEFIPIGKDTKETGISQLPISEPSPDLIKNLKKKIKEDQEKEAIQKEEEAETLPRRPGHNPKY